MSTVGVRVNRALASHWVLLLAVLLNLIWGFWAAPLYDVDEGAFTEATREMMASGNYATIYLNGKPRDAKPILTYWAQAASAHVFGFNQFSLRLPSVLAAIAWVWAIFAFARRHLGRDTAQVAALLLSLSLFVSLIGKSATADALLNLFIALTMFDIYTYTQSPRRRLLLRVFVWMGLGFLTKGPVAIFFPLLVSGLFYLSYGRWREWLRAIFDPWGLLIFVAIVLPWHVAIYLDSGWQFFKGFYLHQNIGRYDSPMEGHSGGIFYYVIAAPLIIMPFAGWLIESLRQLPKVRVEPLDRFVWLWFFCVLIVFSFSSTKLPHYMLYGMSGVLVLMARYRDSVRWNWLHFVPVLLLMALLAVSPQVFGVLAEHARRAYEHMMFVNGARAFSGWPQFWLGALALLAVALMFLRISLWRRMLLIGFAQGMAVTFLVVPLVLGVRQDGPKNAGLFAREHHKQLVFWNVDQPSVSVYAREIIPSTPPRPGQWVYLRTDRLDSFMAQPSPYQRQVVFQQGPATLVAVDAPKGG